MISRNGLSKFSLLFVFFPWVRITVSINRSLFFWRKPKFSQKRLSNVQNLTLTHFSKNKQTIAKRITIKQSNSYKQLICCILIHISSSLRVHFLNIYLIKKELVELAVKYSQLWRHKFQHNAPLKRASQHLVAKLNRTKTSEFIVDSEKLLYPSQKKRGVVKSIRGIYRSCCGKRSHLRSLDASVEVWLLRDGAAHPPDDDVGSVVSGSDALLQRLLFDQC